MTIALLELAYGALGELVTELVFVGGATLEVLTSDPAAPPARPTDDVDVVVQAATRVEYERMAERLRARKLFEDSSSTVICRWRGAHTSLVLDVMPTSPSVFGFANRWYAEVVQTAQSVTLPSGAELRVIAAPYLLATKFEAYADRGAGDIYGSRDLADIVTLLDRRPELLDEIAALRGDVRAYLAQEAGRFLARPDIGLMVSAHLSSDAASQDRAQSIVLPALHAIAHGIEEA